MGEPPTSAARTVRRAPLEPASPLVALPGVGPSRADAFLQYGITCVGHLPWVLPLGWDDLRAPLSVAQAVARAGERERVAVRGKVKSASRVIVRGRPAVRLLLVDDPTARGGAMLFGWWFFLAQGVLAMARPGAPIVLVGRLAAMQRAGSAAMAHPDVLHDEPTMRGVRPRYPRLGVPPTQVARAVAHAMAALPVVPDPVPPAVARREGFTPLGRVLEQVHAPTEPPTAEVIARLRERMAWAEAFTRAWERVSDEASQVRARAVALPPVPAAVERLRLELGFAFTGAQRRAVEAVSADLASDRPMRRLLFGDVGSGKTAVALAAAAQAISAGAQVAILAPTSILAEQYLTSAGPLARSLGARVARIAGATRAVERRHLLRAVADGAIDLLVGTHALLSDDIAFRRLGLVVVDEQQRLGVAQRLSLVRKGADGADATRPHLLTLSATPIPRTLALALRGELATSELRERPPGRTPVVTQAVPRAAFDTVVVAAIRDAVAAGGRVFVVCPRIGGRADDEEEGPEAGPACVDRAASLAEALEASARVVLAHGGMKVGPRCEAMRRLRSGEADVLVGTTVVEVGVDVPEATLMVIDGAEHFGLAQLHQLRGRVGRGTSASRCLLVHDTSLVPTEQARLDALVRIHDGLELAREDLRLRGSGDLGGTRQSGDDDGLVWLDPLAEPAWLERMGDDVRSIAASDPQLAAPEHLGLRLAVERMRRELSIREEAG